MSEAVRGAGGEPAFIGIIGGRPTVGLDSRELVALAREDRKVGARDLPIVIARGLSGGTTVGATVALGHGAGLEVLATGGIGGVHRTMDPADISSDLPILSRTPVVLVCSGAKAILDLPATVEWMETFGIVVVGYGTDEFPAFWSSSSGLPVGARVDDPEEVGEIYRAGRGLGRAEALLVCVPPPAESAIPIQEAEEVVERALVEMEEGGIRGGKVTPFLLDRIAELTEGRSLNANVDLLVNNARVAGEITRALNDSAVR